MLRLPNRPLFDDVRSGLLVMRDRSVRSPSRRKLSVTGAAMTNPLVLLYHKATDSITHWLIGGGVLVATGFAPEEWVAHLTHAIHLGEGSQISWPGNLDLRGGYIRRGRDCGAGGESRTMGPTAGHCRGHLRESDDPLGHAAGVLETEPEPALQETGPQTRPHRRLSPSPRAYRCPLRSPTEDLPAVRHRRGQADPPAYAADRRYPAGHPACHRPHYPRLLVQAM